MIKFEYGKNFPQSNPHEISELVKSFFKLSSQGESRFFSVAQYFTNFIQELKSVDLDRYDHLVHVGIGGSALGAKTLVESLANTSAGDRQGSINRTISFIDNIDSDQLAVALSSIDLQKTLFYFVSKSGGTAETLALLVAITNYYSDQISPQNFLKEHAVIATEDNDGFLRQLTRELQLKNFVLPSDIGGRFSLYTAVGLFPALWCGLDIKEMEQSLHSIENNPQEFLSPWAQLALGIHQLYIDKNINQTVFMPYSHKLKSLAFWFVQLWAESLGKISEKGQAEGLTPIPGVGASDQHSQMQLFIEGPRDKLCLFIEVQKTQHQFALDNNWSDSKLKKLNHKSLHDLMRAELKGSIAALEKAERPTVNLVLPDLSPSAFVHLTQGLQCLTAMMSILLKVNCFDQPGVELGKKLSFEFLNTSH